MAEKCECDLDVGFLCLKHAKERYEHLRKSSNTVGDFLEVGRTQDTHEVVINHPDLMPDENGVGHIVFSPKEARTLARLLIKQASWCESEARGESSPFYGITGGGD